MSEWPQARARRVGDRAASTLNAAIALGVLVAMAVVAVGCGEAETVARKVTDSAIEAKVKHAFFTPPVPLPPAAPGALIRSERLLGAPNGATAWLVMYHSTDLHGHDIPVSGLVVAPSGTKDLGSRPIVSWAHPTTGAAARCAPSVGVDPFDLIEGLGDLLHAGYVVTATDYPGMGVPGTYSYLIGETEGHSVLDAARAARQIPAAGAGTKLVLWGHSQGGQAALFAAEEARTYAPELQLKAVAVAVPAAELADLLRTDISDVSGVTIGAYAFAAFVANYGSVPGVALSNALTPAAADAVPAMAEKCLFGQNGELHRLASPLIGHFLAIDPATVEPWATLLRENTPLGTPIGVPIFVAQGLADTLVRPQTTTDYVAQLCSTGEDVHYVRYRKVTHAFVALRARSEMITTFRDALADRAIPSTC